MTMLEKGERTGSLPRRIARQRWAVVRRTVGRGQGERKEKAKRKGAPVAGTGQGAGGGEELGMREFPVSCLHLCLLSLLLSPFLLFSSVLLSPFPIRLLYISLYPVILPSSLRQESRFDALHSSPSLPLLPLSYFLITHSHSLLLPPGGGRE